jgi:hypothetical protein
MSLIATECEKLFRFDILWSPSVHPEREIYAYSK